MPDGSFDIDYLPPSLDSDALSVVVLLYAPPADAEDGGDPDEPGDESDDYTVLPNVRCLRIERREGPEPSLAQFAYVLDDVAYNTWGWPNQFEELWPLDAQGDYVVQCDDRLVVAGQNPDGSPLYLFDGFAQIPQVDLSGRSQRVTFAAIGVETRTFDDVLHERVQRDADQPDDTSGSSDATVHLPVRFNPADSSLGGQGGFLANSTANTFYTTTSTGQSYPVFLEPLLVERQAVPDSPIYLSPWQIDDAIVYLVSIPGPGDEGWNGLQSDYVTWPSTTAIQTALATLVPDENGVFDPDTATTANCDVRDYDATHKARPEAISELLSYAGFLMCWQLDSDSDGNPETWLKLYRRDAAAATNPKLVYIAASNQPIDPSTTNLSQLHLARDAKGLVTSWRTETNNKQVEISVILAPLFQPAVGDEVVVQGSTTTGRAAWYHSNWTPSTPATQRRKYRWYGADECGDGHYNAQTQTWVTGTPLDLSSVFPPNESTGAMNYCVRYRPGADTLIAEDSLGRPLRATLEISQGAAPGDPAVGNAAPAGCGPWQLITGGWELLPDRLGINVTIEDPEQWASGKAFGQIRGVTWQANPPANKAFALRLTVVIDDDKRMDATAPKRIASPTQYDRRRGFDSRDHFQYASIDVSSANYVAAGGDGTDPVVVRDDTQAALTQSQQLRSSTEMPRLSGTLVIPYITTYYEVGDRIQTIVGRNVDLATSIATDQGEDPTYPWIVGVAWNFDGSQSTTLTLTDERAKPRNAY